ncbi:MFS transporter [Butyricicoccus faecihominis]|uniref:MFS transporter n=1 Tax=Butyricicoccus faecihominis TaxID=1712515 RepID=UPI002479A00D|nr:MFS transporter [Butyricicoccus faecihominis]MCQ5129251.1 MFS transporter [Butyricicoccus faecihominis]
MKQKLFSRDFTLVVIGQIISLFGNAILRFALPLYLLDISGSPKLFGLCSALSFLPMIVLTPMGGVVADRVNKQRIMVVLDFFTCALVTGFTFFMGFAPLIPLLVCTLMLLYGISGAYQPAVQASLPLLCAGDHLLAGNAVINQVSALSGLLGPIIGSVLYSAFGLTPVLIVAAICFFASAVMELFIRIPHTPQPGGASALAVVRDDLKQSLRFIRREKPVLGRYIVLICAFNVFLSALLIIGLPVIVKTTLGLNDLWYGFQQAAMAAGGLIGGVLAGVLARRLNIRHTGLLLHLCAVGLVPIGLALLFGLPAPVSYAVVTLVSAVLMACATLFQVQVLAFAQGVTPQVLTGKVLACLMALSMCAQPVGQAMYGTLFEALTGNEGWILIGAACAALLIARQAHRLAKDL